MAGMKFTADVNVEDIIKLRQEIDKLKKSLIAVAGIPNSDVAIKQLEKEIAVATKKLEEYKNKYLQIQKLKHDIDSSNDAVKKAKDETAALQSTNKWIVANTEAVIETDKQIKQLKKDFSALSDEEKVGDTGTAKIRQIQQLAAQRLVEEEAVRKTIKAQKDQIIQSNAEEGSITALRKQLILLIKDYDDLGRVRRGGDAGKALLTQISNVQKELNAAEQASGRFQRNVGNYASAWNGLGNSVQQVARELPSLAVSANTFFLAISNNLPILVDEIAKARKEYANFKAELKAGNKDVKAVAPVWQQLTRSILSWQTALVVGLTLLSVYGKDVIKWIGSLGKARDVTLDLLSAEQEMALARKSAWSSIAKEQTQLDILYNKLKNVTLSTTERNAAVREWVKNYKTHSDILEGEKVSIDKLNKAYKELTKEIRNSAIARKYEDTLADMSIKREDEEIKRLNQKKTLYDAGLEMSVAQREYERVQREYDKGQTSSQVLSSARVRYLNAVDNWNKEKKVYVDAINTVKKYDENMAVIENHISTLDLFPQPKEGTYDYWQQQVEIADDALKQITSEQKKVLDEASKDSKKDLYGLGIDRAVVDSYKKAVKDKAEAEKQLKVYGDSSKEQKMAEKEAEKRKKEQEKLNEDLLSLRRQNQQAEIDLMEEGTEKKLKQIDLDYQKEIDAIKKQKASWESSQSGRLTDEQTNQLGIWASNAARNREKGITSTNNERLEADKKAWQEYFIQFGNYQEKRKNLIQKYDDEIAKLEEHSAERATKIAEKNQAIDQLDEQFGKSTHVMADLFEDASEKSVSSIQDIIDKYELLIKYMSGTDESVSLINLKSVGFTDKDIANLENGTINIKDITDAIKRLKEEVKGKSPWLSFFSDMKKGIDDIKNANGDTRKFGQGISTIGGAITEFSPAIKQFGSDISSIFGEDLNDEINNVIDGLSGLGQTAVGVGQIMSGDIAGGIMSAVSGVSQLVNAMGNLFGPDGTAYYEGVKEQLEAINEVYDRIIDKSKEDIVFGGGFASVQAATQAMDNYEKKVINLQKIAAASGRAGASWKSHSAEWHSNKNVGAIGGFEQMSDILGKSISSMTDLYSLSGDELFLIQSQMPEAWSLIDARIRENLDSIVACKDEANELRDALNQAMTGVDFDSFYNGFIDQLSDMDTSFEDMCDNFEDYLRKSIMAGLVASQYQGRINALYEQWSDAARSDSKITKNEADLLKEQYQQIVEDMMHDREEMFKTFGWDTSATSQESSKKGFATASQDSIDELNGRFTALQIAGEEIKNQNQLQTMSILELRADMLPIISNTTGIKDIASETRDLLRLSYEELTGIHDDTTSMNKSLKNIETDIAEVKRNTSKL
jgi:chromosome segregation ATPase